MHVISERAQWFLTHIPALNHPVCNRHWCSIQCLGLWFVQCSWIPPVTKRWIFYLKCAYQVWVTPQSPVEVERLCLQFVFCGTCLLWPCLPASDWRRPFLTQAFLSPFFSAGNPGFTLSMEVLAWLPECKWPLSFSWLLEDSPPFCPGFPSNLVCGFLHTGKLWDPRVHGDESCYPCHRKASGTEVGKFMSWTCLTGWPKCFVNSDIGNGMVQ